MSAILNDPGENSNVDGFRLMNESDLDKVIEIEESVYPFPWTRGIFYDCLHIGYCCRVLQKEGSIVAYSVMSVAVEESHLLTIVVDPAHQREGYGKTMLNKMIKLAASHHAKTMYLEVRPSNKAAVQLYHQRGFNEVGVRSNYYPAEDGREDALIMALDLTTDSYPCV